VLLAVATWCFQAISIAISCELQLYEQLPPSAPLPVVACRSMLPHHHPLVVLPVGCPFPTTRHCSTTPRTTTPRKCADTRAVKISTRDNAIVNRLNKTKTEREVDHESERQERLRSEGRKKKAAAIESVSTESESRVKSRVQTQLIKPFRVATTSSVSRVVLFWPSPWTSRGAQLVR
jgi:hypothetical protein